MPYKIASECIFLGEYRTDVLSRKRREAVSQKALGRAVPGKKEISQAIVCQMESGERDWKPWDARFKPWFKAYELPASQFLRMFYNAQEYKALPEDQKSHWLSEKKRFAKAMPLFERPPQQAQRVIELETEHEAYRELLG